MKYKKSAIVVGTGFGGVSIAAYLANNGFNVTVLEKNNTPGGRARVWEKKGFRFDMGPSWYLMPDIFERFFKDMGRKSSEFYKIIKLDPSYRIIFAKDEVIDISADIQDTFKLFDEYEEAGSKKFKKYLDQAELQYNISLDHILYKNIKSPLDFIQKGLIRKGRKLSLLSSLQKKVDKTFESDRLKKILLYNIVFLGANPKKTPAIYSLMSHVDFNIGVWYPMGGIGQVIEAIVKIGEDLSVNYIYDKEVSQFYIEDKKIKTVKTIDGDEYHADLVVVNADYAHAETTFLPYEYQQYPQKYWEKKVIAPSAYIIYLGLNRKYKNLKHHTLVLDNDWQVHFDEIFDDPKWPESPSYYVCAPSQSDPTMAPEGHENIFVLVPVASNLDDNEQVRNHYFDKIINHLEDLIGEKIRKHIVVKRIYSHQDFKNDYNAYKGSALGLSHTLMQSVMFRPKHKSKKVKNLYYTGQYTHPGIGMPMALISSKLVIETIMKDYK
jgi:1-hydroxy-2-isopentenylcarotenoid 3,4-desaturase